MKYVEIAVAAPIDRTLTYILPDEVISGSGEQASETLIGRRVLVPLGGRKVTGYLLDEAGVVDNSYQLRKILELLDPQPLFPAALIGLFRWVAEYYHYPIGEVIRAALPSGLTPKSKRVLELTDEGRRAFSQKDQGREAWKQTLMTHGRLTAAVSRELLGDEDTRGEIRRLLRLQQLKLVQIMTGNDVREKRETCYRLNLAKLDLPGAHVGELDDLQKYRQQLALETGDEFKLSEAKTVYHLARCGSDETGGLVPRKELLEAYGGAAKALHALMARGLVLQEERRVFRNPLGEKLERIPAPSALTEEQRLVMTELLPAIAATGYSSFLLHGVTGSGKTEIYLQAAAACLARGRSVLVLVPEIALATQLEAHFVSRFGDQVVLLHSGLTASERFDQWSLAMNGSGRIVIGARSAVFAPLADPGLIIVDEEHDGGLKQDDGLRYHGRDLAVVRARIQGAVVLLGSATPAVVSYHNALSGKYRLLTMDKRVGDRSLPKVTIIDLRKPQPSGKRSLFRPLLADALRANLQKGRQSVVLLNRRGFSSNVICQECGTPVQCRDCHVTLTLHRRQQRLLCHYCGYGVPEMTVCESCGSTQLVPVGFGTERVEAELHELLPDARIARLDTDTARDRNAFVQILKLMRAGEIDVLVGTQMIAKGHHFPGVTLVGVVWADGGLAIPDYRAAERTFQLITQVTGRAGRGEEPGEVFIQTMRPDHYAIALARSHSYRELVKKELDLRRNPPFPPFVRLVAVHIQGESEADVETSASRIAAACRSIIGTGRRGLEILGPAPSPIDRLRKNYRWQVMFKGESAELLDGLCRYVRLHSGQLAVGRCQIILDRDPENLL